VIAQGAKYPSNKAAGLKISSLLMRDF